jgi:thiamine kinase-like enzyme
MAIKKEIKTVMTEYTYLFIDNSLYLNLNQRFLSLMYYLFFKSKSFNFLEKKTKSKLFNSFIHLVRIIRVLEIAYLYYRKKHMYKKSKDSFPTITTIFYGHCLIVLRLGEYKIINYRKKDVTTVYPSNLSINEIEKEILKFIDSQKCNLAPRIIKWDINRRYIKEYYINLRKPSFYFGKLHNFYLEIFPILKNIMLSTSPQVILVSQYAQNLFNSIDKYIETNSNKSSYSGNNTNIVLEFISFIKGEIGNSSSKNEILLVLSHGDLSEGNVLKSKRKSSVIDWNTLDVRSCYFDFYYILFDIAFKTKEAERTNIPKEMGKAFKYFQLYLIENTHFDSELKTDIINQIDTYRYLFYLEFILLRLQEYSKRDQSDWNFLMNWINIFKFHENNKKEDILLSAQLT